MIIEQTRPVGQVIWRLTWVQDFIADLCTLHSLFSGKSYVYAPQKPSEYLHLSLEIN